MAKLADIQDAFGQALEARNGAPGGLFRAPFERGWQVYRSNHILNRADAMIEAFPTVRALVGNEFFGGMARAYTRVTPSQSANLHDFGATFAEFIARFEPASHLPYLADVARMDWACHRAALASDADPLGTEAFAALPEASLVRLTLRCHPSLSLLRSDYPLAAMRRAHRPGYAGDWNFDDEPRGAFFVLRQREGVTVQPIAPALAQFLSALVNGIPLGETIEAVHIATPEFDLASALLFCFTNEVLVGFEFADA